MVNNTVIENKSIEDSFRDWENSAFGFGYGTGECYTIPALRDFFSLCNEGPYNGSYDYHKLEEKLTPAIAWMLINLLCNHRIDMIEYGTSPRGGWLTKKGERLRDFMLSHTAEELVNMATDRTEDSNVCYPDVCNCGEHGYVGGRECPNPFWGKD